MTFDPIAADLAVRAARATAGSARPDAPVVPDRAPRPPRLRTTRTRSAAVLHAVARWVEPQPAGSPRRA
ncbi:MULTISPECIES: hypothetical protein [unclassified Nocardioides]|jgi:hypothetical protein|uniref:hypothetical protein n=1 Tax=Nocardioides sp. URHA0032 TaxID=1380388 RepID=UPI00048B871E|nr:hypothetical protein [Nocardioides sp. URHA0032]